jgi:23S rRNA pseudouridine1911/1915/1917 synthase
MPLHFLVTPEKAGQRLDKFLGTGCPNFSRARLQAFIRDGHALVNKIAAKPSYPLRAGDEVVFEIPQETVPSPLAAQDMPIDQCHESPKEKPASPAQFNPPTPTPSV